VTTAVIGVANMGSALARHLVNGDETVILAAKDQSRAQAHHDFPRLIEEIAYDQDNTVMVPTGTRSSPKLRRLDLHLVLAVLLRTV
jgi:predicted dinucleotide-binding enzyme